jgi:hypothetical protein
MASLTGNSVGSSYLGLLKTTDNAAIDGTLKNMTDGAGNATPLSMANDYVQLQAPTIELIESTGGTNLMMISPTNVYFEGAVDFTNASVTGLGGGPGLVASTGSNSMKSADALTPSNVALASGNFAVAIGGDTIASGGTATALGFWAKGIGSSSVAIGAYTRADGSSSFGAGHNVTAGGGSSVAIGRLAATSAGTSNGIAIGNNAKSRANNCVILGPNALVDDSIRVDTVLVGSNTKAAQYSTALGANAYAVGDYAISIGDANTYATGAIAIGDQAQSFNNGAVALGRNINAVAWNDSTTVNQLAFANVANLNFVDQAAAVAGGVPTGGLYHTDGTVKIVY